jgi:hypothetical protein
MRFMKEFEPKDLIAVLTLIGSFFLVLNGDQVVGPLIITTVVGFYFGHITGIASANSSTAAAAASTPTA